MESPVDAPRTDPTGSFLHGLEKAGYQPAVSSVRGTVMLELTGIPVDEHWLIAMDEGLVVVSGRPGPADTVVRMPKELFAEAVRGRANLWTAVLRNEVTVEGKLFLLIAFERLLPGGPPGYGSSGTPGRSR